MVQPSLDDIRLFVSVVQAGSLSSASELTGITVSKLSRRLTHLENTLGTQLLNRGKKGVTLNELGERFFEHAQNMLKEADNAISSIHKELEEPTGLLRISVATDIGHRYLIPLLDGYLAAYPRVSLDINFSQQKINMIQDGIDISIRVGTIQNENVVARTWMMMEFGIYATAEYLSKHGVPKTPSDLYKHKIIAQTLSMPWHFSQEHKTVKVSPNAYIGCNDYTMVDDMIIKGLGVGKMCKTSADKHPELVELLGDWKIDPVPISLIYYKNRGAFAAVRSFVDWLMTHCKSDPVIPLA